MGAGRKKYAFDTPDGEQTLADLFDGRGQLVVYHFMFSPDWEEGCKHCSFWADNFDGIDVHLASRDVTLPRGVAGAARQDRSLQQRMGWRFKWVSSFGSDFNFDYQVSFTPEELESGAAFYNYATRTRCREREGVSVFYQGRRTAPSSTPIRPTPAASTC